MGIYIAERKAGTMDATKIARYYGSQEWVYKVLRRATATKFQRWKAMLRTNVVMDVDDVAEAMVRYAREMCCSEIERAAVAVHDACQAGDATIDAKVDTLCEAIDRL